MIETVDRNINDEIKEAFTELLLIASRYNANTICLNLLHAFLNNNIFCLCICIFHFYLFVPLYLSGALSILAIIADKYY